MSADGDMVRTIEAMVSVVQKAADEGMEFGETIDLWKKATRYLELANMERYDWLYASDTMTEAEHKESMDLYRFFWPSSHDDGDED